MSENTTILGTPFRVLSFLMCFVICIWCGGLFANDVPPPRPLFPDDPKGALLPPGVPRLIDTYGNVIAINHQFTTPQYRQAAVRLLLREANRVAVEMKLPGETLPITRFNLTDLTVLPFGYSCIHKAIGVVCTSNYVYMVSCGDKFCGLTVANYDKVCSELAKSSLLPVKQLDTNGFAEAYELATQWLASASMDVDGLNRAFTPHIALSSLWNGVSRLGQVPRRNFVPIYYVWWTSPENDAKGFGGVARVELFLPTKRLIQMSVDDAGYILREPLVFTNLPSLFPGTGRVIILKGETGPIARPRPF